jgi:hypothetical protein
VLVAICRRVNGLGRLAAGREELENLKGTDTGKDGCGIRRAAGADQLGSKLTEALDDLVYVIHAVEPRRQKAVLNSRVETDISLKSLVGPGSPRRIRALPFDWAFRGAHSQGCWVVSQFGTRPPLASRPGERQAHAERISGLKRLLSAHLDRRPSNSADPTSLQA